MALRLQRRYKVIDTELGIEVQEPFFILFPTDDTLMRAALQYYSSLLLVSKETALAQNILMLLHSLPSSDSDVSIPRQPEHTPKVLSSTEEPVVDDMA